MAQFPKLTSYPQSEGEQRDRDVRLLTLAMYALLIIGFGVRLRQYLTGRSLWLDEAMLALNIVERSFLQLAQPLKFAQGAPLGFLWIQKVVTYLVGTGEMALRLVPFLTGLLALLLFPRVADRYLSRLGMIIALALFAISPRVIYYAAELKQYSVDVLCSIVALLLMIQLEEKNYSIKWMIGTGVVGALMVWLSHPVIFVLAAEGVILLVKGYKGNRLQGLLHSALPILVWGTSFTAIYFITLADLSEHSVLQEYWKGSFPPSLGNPTSTLHWITNSFLGLLANPVGFALPQLALFLFLTGTISIGLRDKYQLASLIYPLVAVLAASFARKYPFADRLLLFLVPHIMIVIAGGADCLISNTKSAIPAVFGYLAVIALLYQPAMQMVEEFISPHMGEDLAPMVAYIDNNRNRKDAIYVYYASSGPFRYYLLRYDFSPEEYVIGIQSRDDWSGYLPQLHDFAENHKRIWLLFSHVYSNDTQSEEDYLTDYVVHLGGRLIDSQSASNASVHLFEMNDPSN